MRFVSWAIRCIATECADEFREFGNHSAIGVVVGVKVNAAFATERRNDHE